MSIRIVLASLASLGVAITAANGYARQHTAELPVATVTPRPIITTITRPPASPQATPSPSIAPTPVAPRPVPFVVQAPFNQWHIPMYEDGCEEAVVLMVQHWLRSTAPTPAEMATELQHVTTFADKAYGQAYDRSTADTAQLVRDYVGHSRLEVRYDISSSDITDVFSQGGVVIVPTNGRRNGSPYYTPPGPIRHMVLLHGYDAAKREFVAHDPGTMYGENVRFTQDVFLAAIQDYATGNKEPLPKQRSAMIAVFP